MAILPIYTFPHPVLSAKAESVNEAEFGQGELSSLLSDMEETLLASGGVGLAAPQVGVSKRVLVIDEKLIETKDDDEPQHGFIRVVNPELSWASDEVQCDEEGCLSFPDITVPVERAEKVKVSYSDEQGNRHLLESQGLLARCIQHEMDHLDGVTIPDRLRMRTKLRFMMAYTAHMNELGRPATFEQASGAMRNLVSRQESSRKL